MTSSTLHSVSLVLQSAGSLSVFLALLMLWIKLRTHRQKSWLRFGRGTRAKFVTFVPTSQASGDSSSSRPSPIKGTDRLLAALVIMAGVTMLLSFTNAIVEAHSMPVVEDYYVHVDRVLPFTWWVHSAKRGHYRIDLCTDHEQEVVLKEINAQAGYTIRKIRYQPTMWGCKKVYGETAETGPLQVLWVVGSDGFALKETIAVPSLCSGPNCIPTAP